MNQPQLPAHLQNRQSRHLSETATQGLGGALPPHISIQGNAFCLIDATGAEQPVVFVNPADGRQYNQPYLDVCIVDISDVVCKQYYGGKAWTPDSKDPPVCWSANGVGPSKEAPQPQSPTCQTCPQNVRGSAVSKISGVAIKACRDEKWLALVLPGFGKDMAFRLVLTPGSFQNWKGYVEKFRGQQVDISDVVTRIEFEQGVNGVLAFNVAPQGYIDAPTAELRERLLTAKATDIFVGRTDMPIQALPAPAVAPALAGPTGPIVPSGPGPFGHAAGPMQPFPPAQPAPTAGFQPTPGPAPFPPAAPAAPPASFPNAGSFPSGGGFQQPAFAGTASAGGPVGAPTGATQTSPSEPGRRKRRTAAEMAAARGAPAQPLPNPSVAPFPVAPGPAAFPIGTPAQPAPAAAAAPAAPPGPTAPPAVATPQFGIVNNPPGPGGDLAAMLNQHFGPPGGTAAGGAPR